MGRRQSSYLARVQAAADRQVADRQVVHTQMCLDAAMLAANEVFHMGPTRARAFAAAFSAALMEIAELTLGDTADMAYTKDKLDRRLREICGEHFQPWDERYGG